MKVTPEFFLRLLELRDAYTRGHTERGVIYALEIGKALGLTEEELKLLEVGGYIHDIGKIAIPDVVLLKPSRLTKEEYEIMKLHVELGYEIIKDVGFPKESVEVLLYHQEKYNGTGYPFGKKGKEIPLLARIYKIADSFEAMTSRRVYKKAKKWEVALNELEELAGLDFDPDIVPYAVKALKELQGKIKPKLDLDSELEKIRWSFYFTDFTGAIKGDLFLSTLRAFIEKGDPFCLTLFDIENLFEINQERGWEKGNEVLQALVYAIKSQCCGTSDPKELVIKLMRADIYDISVPVIFRLGSDEFGVIAPYIPPPEKVENVAKFMKDLGVKIKYVQKRFPEDFQSVEDILHLLMKFQKRISFSQ